MNPVFGGPWNSPLCDGAPRVATPVGQLCLWCGVPVEAGDCGFLVACTRTAEDGSACATVEPEHRECLARAVTGSPAHLKGTCRCRDGGAPDSEPDSPAGRRAEAIAVWEHLHGGG